jgi:hypothetical protein
LTKVYLWVSLLDQVQSLVQLDSIERPDPLCSWWRVEHRQEPRVGFGYVPDGEQSSPGSRPVEGVHILGEAQGAVEVGGFGCTLEFHSVFDR